MPFIPVDFDEVKESGPAPAGKYELQIVECIEAKTGPNAAHPGDPQLRVTIGFPNDPDTMNLMHYVSLPGGADGSKDKGKALFLKRFLDAFHIPYDSKGIDTEKLCMEAPGCAAILEVSLSEPDGNGNVYNRLILPRLPRE